MIRHLIVFNAREDVTQEECLAMAERGRRELTQVPGVINVSFGVAVVQNSRYKYNFTIDLTDEQALHVYTDHPLHVEFANTYFRPMAPDRITTDYEVLY